jgi:hypothetical protein
VDSIAFLGSIFTLLSKKDPNLSNKTVTAIFGVFASLLDATSIAKAFLRRQSELIWIMVGHEAGWNIGLWTEPEAEKGLPPHATWHREKGLHRVFLQSLPLAFCTTG